MIRWQPGTKTFECSNERRKRLDAAWYLFNHEGKQFNLDGVYLAGYAVECALKASILKRTSRSQHLATMAILTEVGAKGHEFEYLKKLLKDRMQKSGGKDFESFGKLTVSFQRVTGWSTDLRYQVGFLETKVTAAFLEAAEEILRWSLRG